MNLRITGKNNLELTDALKNAVEKKLRILDKFFNEDTDVNVVLSVVKNDQIVEVTIPYKGVIFRAEAATEDMYSTLDEVVEKLKKQWRKHKTKLEKRFNVKVPENLQLTEEDEEKEVSEEEFRIVRKKKFGMKPMSVEEAILQMNLLGHDFYIFCNEESNDINVVYRRRDGSYGLIEAEKV
ncbi:SSU ribosomal protein S30P/sigma 54 modulation protein [Caldanaerobius fijiensis DSM 17918]|uniref:Ribosome hibernation promoting factor n=1 Tax=Caldanaerobius fijiensis DSM 17918 TaxID=1121256 RepID=A0A1M4UZ30_9THEO|nr:ribosome-associated translation inhibitor RaiA [Caldanaerobius fijiensis]SHE61919.1 SSU ribosomal protein S30P/sigma 54 modulation protein [Caldanaerobius fijiensis DSM 17918]